MFDKIKNIFKKPVALTVENKLDVALAGANSTLSVFTDYIDDLKDQSMELKSVADEAMEKANHYGYMAIKANEKANHVDKVVLKFSQLLDTI